MWEAPSLNKLQDAVASPANPIGMRMRAAYFLRQAYDNAVRNSGDDENDECKVHIDNNATTNIEDIVIETLGSGLKEIGHGSLLRHEFAYVMGQLRDERCCDYLEQVLSDNSDCIMVRHECGEALGAIGAQRSISVLEAAIKENPDSPEIGQTCEIALAHMKWKMGSSEDEEEPMACACMLSPYSSIDPAPPHPKHVNLSTEELGCILLDTSLPLFERYRAMFSLRNRGGSSAVIELGKALTSDTSSTLFRHEIAYVLGQMHHSASIEYLAESLRRQHEHQMVRHESAEALGAIEDKWEECEKLLLEFSEDADIVVRESCMVALDAADYWGHGNNAQTNENIDEEEIEIAASKNLSFVLQKAVTNGKSEFVNSLSKKAGSKNEVIHHHFNLAT
uniref:Deoxyhypusine hydroxylase n=1 Tax=Eucampia antarctica TaxID=49252 RepID=A0A7S2RIA9_9STRA|mmetsp:Transcript_22103/g.21240  ORF Transcript_22103/g.21240 Transcript_22103/m.21240 type:complete len:393 (+) Transcript_22103:56-1234(+)|eukprot:CAMPEP_0197841378 /NCGR_PEP_ID=MMETSP1437-20131217/46136_1 /TAXON_ID=49252 ORGANISM="Eucampia antarctica, Strain CCMP1452" /NCGR_SAMPLE_ID=MMETSP1437 /ASSEMBLY_ACC=CAM_ASM_001096 /LENGTH=392 /DNA_ID=CAMNT_0043451115 /DNA_START=22 /DNA_END=1200 /DNA_ORIENTATION=+